MYKKILLLLLSLACWTLLTAQPQSSTNVLARAELGNTQLTIGDKVELRVNISAPPGTQVGTGDWRSSNADGGGLPTSLEVAEANPLNTIAETPELLLEQRWTLQTFDTGYVFVPALAYPYKLAGSNQMDTAYTEPLLITIKGIPLNNESELMPINPIIKEGRNWQDFWPIYLGLLLLIGGLALWRWFKYKADSKVVPPPPPPKPAHVLALEALQELEQEKVWQSGQIKAYYSELSRILRVYLEGRFKIPAMESTTKQIARSLAAKSDFDPQQSGELSQLLQLSDLVKFAKAEPGEDLHQRGLERVRSFVQNTVPSLTITNDPSEEE